MNEIAKVVLLCKGVIATMSMVKSTQFYCKMKQFESYVALIC